MKEKLGIKNIVLIAVIVGVAFILFMGKNSSDITNPSDAAVFAEAPDGSIYIGDRNAEEIMKAIKVAGEKNGWKITEFKSNELIAEKLDNGDTVSASVKLYSKYIAFLEGSASSSDISELREYVEEELESSQVH